MGLICGFCAVIPVALTNGLLYVGALLSPFSVFA